MTFGLPATGCYNLRDIFSETAEIVSINPLYPPILGDF
jgi:hypothetical protein